MKHITIYTDGACSRNPGPGGWGSIIRYDDGREVEISGGLADTTNNQMELLGVIRALESIEGTAIVDLYSDSRYVIDGLSKGWAKQWSMNGWKKSDGKPAKNTALWDRLLKLVEWHVVTYHWVKGHAENPWNNRCDQLAVTARLKYENPAPAPVVPAPERQDDRSIPMSDADLELAVTALTRTYAYYDGKNQQELAAEYLRLADRLARALLDRRHGSGHETEERKDLT